ncbi:TSCPD domain-containing protein, partial [Dysosmobacter welbionis]
PPPAPPPVLPGTAGSPHCAWAHTAPAVQMGGVPSPAAGPTLPPAPSVSETTSTSKPPVHSLPRSLRPVSPPRWPQSHSALPPPDPW